ncbi:MAG TPA: adenine phosphoribosyltransferase [Thermoanaerobaculia bacterium]
MKSVDLKFATVRNFPRTGFVFPDITVLLESGGPTFRHIVDALAQPYQEQPPQCLLCIESFGYIFGGPIAYHLGCRIVLARKAGKLARRTVRRPYSMCYAEGKCLEINRDAIPPGATVALVDDFLASGGTALAAAALCSEVGGRVVAASFVAELESHEGRRRLEQAGIPVRSICSLSLNPYTEQWEVARSEFESDAGFEGNSRC